MFPLCRVTLVISQTFTKKRVFNCDPMIPLFSGYAFWLQPARTRRNSSLPLHHGLPCCQNGQLRRGKSSLENSEVDCSRSLFGAGRPYGSCHGRKFGISHVYWERGSLQVSDVNKTRRSSGMWVCMLQDMLHTCVKSCMSCVQSCENILSSVTWIVLFVVSSHDIGWSCLRCMISVICVWLCIVATDHEKSVW